MPQVSHRRRANPRARTLMSLCRDADEPAEAEPDRAREDPQARELDRGAKRRFLRDPRLSLRP